MCACLKQGQIHGAYGTHARTGGDATAAVLQLGDVVFQSADGGIPDARIDVAFFLPGKQGRAMRSIPESECGRLVDGNIDRTSCVRLVPGMNQFAVNTQVFRVHEFSFWLPGRHRVDASNRPSRSSGKPISITHKSFANSDSEHKSGDRRTTAGNCPTRRWVCDGWNLAAVTNDSARLNIEGDGSDGKPSLIAEAGDELQESPHIGKVADQANRSTKCSSALVPAVLPSIA